MCACPTEGDLPPILFQANPPNEDVVEHLWTARLQQNRGRRLHLNIPRYDKSQTNEPNAEAYLNMLFLFKAVTVKLNEYKDSHYGEEQVASLFVRMNLQLGGVARGYWKEILRAHKVDECLRTFRTCLVLLSRKILPADALSKQRHYMETTRKPSDMDVKTYYDRLKKMNKLLPFMQDQWAPRDSFWSEGRFTREEIKNILLRNVSDEWQQKLYLSNLQPSAPLRDLLAFFERLELLDKVEEQRQERSVSMLQRDADRNTPSPLSSREESEDGREDSFRTARNLSIRTEISNLPSREAESSTRRVSFVDQVGGQSKKQVDSTDPSWAIHNSDRCSSNSDGSSTDSRCRGWSSRESSFRGFNGHDSNREIQQVLEGDMGIWNAIMGADVSYEFKFWGGEDDDRSTAPSVAVTNSEDTFDRVVKGVSWTRPWAAYIC